MSKEIVILLSERCDSTWRHIQKKNQFLFAKRRMQTYFAAFSHIPQKGQQGTFWNGKF